MNKEVCSAVHAPEETVDCSMIIDELKKKTKRLNSKNEGENNQC